MIKMISSLMWLMDIISPLLNIWFSSSISALDVFLFYSSNNFQFLWYIDIKNLNIRQIKFNIVICVYVIVKAQT